MRQCAWGHPELVACPPGKPVWQCSLRTAPADRVLSDDEWAEAAEELMHQTGIAPRDDPDACRWIAVRHADDHVHVVAMLAREDGRRPDVTRDYLKVRKACRVLEERWGLHRTAPADRTAAPRPTRPEIERARRAGGREPTRCALRRRVAAVAASAGGEEAFFAGLRERGLLVRLRFSVRTPGRSPGSPSRIRATRMPLRLRSTSPGASSLPSSRCRSCGIGGAPRAWTCRLLAGRRGCGGPASVSTNGTRLTGRPPERRQRLPGTCARPVTRACVPTSLRRRPTFCTWRRTSRRTVSLPKSRTSTGARRESRSGVRRWPPGPAMV
ncbi:relaxase/mobilization nuclease domain-containing protein [Actinomadura sp. WAC 06369]|uniref:relaxase/mobilization nuclease domain-containing protein n=1 Tax=Actinomadura sp. WAC 06369 TaxID=2203193 RepID=UPI003FA3C829